MFGRIIVLFKWVYFLYFICFFYCMYVETFLGFSVVLFCYFNCYLMVYGINVSELFICLVDGNIFNLEWLEMVVIL